MSDLKVQVSMVKCFWCGGDKGEIAIGEQLKAEEAPRYIITGYDPCQECVDQIADNIRFIEVVNSNPDGRPALHSTDGRDFFPTGRMLLLSRESSAKLLTKDVVEDVLKAGQTLVGLEGFEKILVMFNESKEEHDDEGKEEAEGDDVQGSSGGVPSVQIN